MDRVRLHFRFGLEGDIFILTGDGFPLHKADSPSVVVAVVVVMLVGWSMVGQLVTPTKLLCPMQCCCCWINRRTVIPQDRQGWLLAVTMGFLA